MRNEFIRENNIRHNETPGASFQDNGFWFQAISLAKSVVMFDYRGLSVSEVTELRKKLRENGADYKVYKNIFSE